MLIVNLKREIISYNERFQDIWELSKKSLCSRTETASLKEAMKKVDDPMKFYTQVTSMYAKNKLESKIVTFRSGLFVESVPRYIDANKIKCIAWATRVKPNNEIKKNIISSLTQREKQILYYYLFGFTVKAIANKLFISHRTVEDYVYNLKIKFNCYNRDNFISKAKLLGLIKVESPDFVKCKGLDLI